MAYRDAPPGNTHHNCNRYQLAMQDIAIGRSLGAHQLSRAGSISNATLLDTVGVFTDVLLPTIAEVVFGDSDAEDHEVSMAMARLRALANWAFLAPQRSRLRDRLL